MTFRDLWTAAAVGALLLIVMAAAAFGALTLSLAAADHPAIRAAIAATPAEDLGAPAIDRWRLGFLEGYFPECADLSLLLHEDATPNPAAAAIRAETIIPPPTTTICRELQRALGDEDSVAWFTYARYWHGALLLHRAVLSVWSYATLQAIAAGLVLLAGSVLFAALAWRVSPAAAAVLILPLALLSDALAIGGLPVQAVSFTALLAVAAAFAAFGATRTGAAALVAAALAGAAYNFFDFFCNPECLAALCAWSWAAAARVRGERRAMRGTALMFAAVLGGYVAFWALKWAIATGYGLAGGEVYLFNVGDFERWTPPGWMPGRAWAAVLMRTFDAWWKSAIGIVVVLGIARMLHTGTKRSSLAPLLVPLPLAWLILEAMAGHTLAHPAIMFRLVPLTLGLVAASVLVARQTIPAVRKPAIAASS